MCPCHCHQPLLSLWHNNVVKTRNINSFEIILHRHSFRHIFIVSQKPKAEERLHGVQLWALLTSYHLSSKHHNAGISQMLSAQHSSSNTKASYILLKSLVFFPQAISSFYKAQNNLYQLYSPQTPSSMGTALFQIFLTLWPLKKFQVYYTSGCLKWYSYHLPLHYTLDRSTNIFTVKLFQKTLPPAEGRAPQRTGRSKWDKEAMDQKEVYSSA